MHKPSYFFYRVSQYVGQHVTFFVDVVVTNRIAAVALCKDLHVYGLFALPQPLLSLLSLSSNPLHLLSHICRTDYLVLLHLYAKHLPADVGLALLILIVQLVIIGELVEARRTIQRGFCLFAVLLHPLLVLFILYRVIKSFLCFCLFGLFLGFFIQILLLVLILLIILKGLVQNRPLHKPLNVLIDHSVPIVDLLPLKDAALDFILLLEPLVIILLVHLL